MQSDQERLMAAASQWSVGGPFVFTPDKWILGSGTREPADLAIYCNKCLILAFLSQTTHDDDFDRSLRRLRKGMAHNLKQATGALRLWQNRPIEGSNSFQHFSVRCGEPVSVTILSVIQGNGAFAVRHAYSEMPAGIQQCVTIPFAVFERYSKMGAGLFNVFRLLNAVRPEAAEIPEVAILHAIEAHLRQARLLSGAHALWPNGEINEDFLHAATMVQFLRGSYKADKNADIILASIFNDLPLVVYYRLIVMVWLAIDGVWAAAHLRPSAHWTLEKIQATTLEAAAELNSEGFSVSVCTIPNPPARPPIRALVRPVQFLPATLVSGRRRFVVTAFELGDASAVKQAARKFDPDSAGDKMGSQEILLAFAVIKFVGVMPIWCFRSDNGRSNVETFFTRAMD